MTESVHHNNRFNRLIRLHVTSVIDAVDYATEMRWTRAIGAFSNVTDKCNIAS